MAKWETVWDGWLGKFVDRRVKDESDKEQGGASFHGDTGSDEYAEAMTYRKIAEEREAAGEDRPRADPLPPAQGNQ